MNRHVTTAEDADREGQTQRRLELPDEWDELLKNPALLFPAFGEALS